MSSGKWRQLYERAEEAHRQKAAGLGERLRAMTQAERKSRQTRHVEVHKPCYSLATCCFSNLHDMVSVAHVFAVSQTQHNFMPGPLACHFAAYYL